MLKHTKKILVAVAAMGLMAPVMEKSASAIPVFARQINAPCETCHLQHIPRLNDMGRSFKLSAMTMTSDAKNIEGMELPLVGNIAFFTKLRYDQQTANAPGAKASGEIALPDEAALWVGGKMAKNWGAAIEGAGQGYLSGKFITSYDALGGKVGFALFSTDAIGPFWGMELMSTGLTGNTRGWENRDVASAALTQFGTDKVSQTAGAAAGYTAFLNTADLTVALGSWGPAAPGAAPDTALSNTSLRVIYQVMPELLVGYYSTTLGSAYNADQSGAKKSAATNSGIDVQWANEAKNLSVVFSNALGGAEYDTNSAAAGTEFTTLVSAMNLGVTYTVMEHLNVKAAYTSRQTGHATTAAGTQTKVSGTATGLGVVYGFAPNVELSLENVTYSGDSFGLKSRNFIVMEIVF